MIVSFKGKLSWAITETPMTMNATVANIMILEIGDYPTLIVVLVHAALISHIEKSKIITI